MSKSITKPPERQSQGRGDASSNGKAETPPADVAEKKGKRNAAALDPATEAARFLKALAQDDISRLRFWRGTFWLWDRGAYRELQTAEARARLIGYINTRAKYLTTSITANIIDQLRALSLLPSATEPPAWLGEPPVDWPAGEVLAARNGLVHLPSLADKIGKHFRRPTPQFFTTAALDYDFDAEAAEPTEWLRFLNELWPDDEQSIATLQEWAGLLLTPDTRHHKILLVVGPKRAGKGTISRVLRALIGPSNVAGPTLASLSQNFGLWPLLGRSLAIISDARLSGRTDSAIVVERLLSISGEDALTIDRKNLEPVTCKLPTRLMILTNELPRLGDSSGALAGRMIVLRLTETFYGREDHELTHRLLTELPGILLWAIEGWRRLRERGRFVQPDTALELASELDDLTSPVGAFVRERCTVGAAHRTGVDDLFAAWGGWCEKNGRKEHGTVQSFARDLLAAVPGLHKGQGRDGDQRFRFYEGIGLAKESF